MSCASAIDMHENEAFDDYEFDAKQQLDDESFLMAETQDKLLPIAYSRLDDIDNNDDDDVINDIVDADAIVNSVNININAEDNFKNNCNDDDNIDYDDDDDDNDENEIAMEHEHLLAYHNDIAEEAVNLLLPEIEPTAGLDCTNFVDFDEFNLCLTNILSDNDDDDVVLSTEDIIGVSTNDAGQHNESATTVVRSSSNWNKFLTQNNTQIDDILNVVQIGDDDDSNEYEGVASKPAINLSSSATTTVTTALTKIANNHPNCDKIIRTKYYHQQEIESEFNLMNACPIEISNQANSPRQEQQQQQHEQKLAVGGSATSTLDVISRNSHGIVNLFQ